MAAAAPVYQKSLNIDVYGPQDPLTGRSDWHITSAWDQNDLKQRVVAWLHSQQVLSREQATMFVENASHRSENGYPFTSFPILDGRGNMIGILQLERGPQLGTLSIGAHGLDGFNKEKIPEILSWCLHQYLPNLCEKGQWFPIYSSDNQQLLERVPLSDVTLTMQIPKSEHDHLAKVITPFGFKQASEDLERCYYQLPISDLLRRNNG